MEEGLEEGEEIVMNVYEFAKAGSKNDSMQGIPGMGRFMRPKK